MRKRFDVIVVGIGGVGSATAMHLADRGLSVLGIDRFEPGHGWGSSHGESRAIRKAYFEHPDYVPLLKRAYRGWQSLEERSGQQLLQLCGLLEIGAPDGTLIQGVRSAALQHQLALEEVTPSEFRTRFPGFALPEDHVALFEPDGGLLRVEKCVQAFYGAAQDAGAEFALGETVVEWRTDSERVCRVTTDRNQYQAQHLVFCAGAWTTQLLTQLGLEFRVLRKHLHWYAVRPGGYALGNGSPVFFYETHAGYYYGFPQLGDARIKVAEHSGGEMVDDPLAVNRAVDPEEVGRVEKFLQDHLLDVVLRPVDHQVCMYTMSPDEHFVIDQHPEHPQVVFAAGLSGHGFKFASALGECLAEAVLTGQMPGGLDFLGIGRFHRTSGGR